MRTKNAKRLWPVPATLAVMALAAFLAFGLMATTSAQPAAAQDGADCDVAVEIDTDSAGSAVVEDNFPAVGGDSNPEDCRAMGGTATIRFTGSLATNATPSDPAKLDLLIQDDSGPIRAYLNGHVGYDSSTDNRYEITAAGETAMIGTVDDEAPAPMRFRIQTIEVPLPARNAQGQTEDQSVDVSVSGDVYIFAPNADVTEPIPGVPMAQSDKRDQVFRIDANQIVSILFLGAPSFGKDGGDANEVLDDIQQCELSADVTMKAERPSDGDCPTGYQDDASDLDEESRTKLVVATITNETVSGTPTAVLGGGTANHQLMATSGRETIRIFTIVQDAEDNPLTGIDVDFSADATPGNVVASRDLSDDDETEAFGDDLTVTMIEVTDAVASYTLDSLPTDTLYRIEVDVMAGNLKLGTVVLYREGDPMTIKGDTFSMACLTAAGAVDSYTDDMLNLNNMNCGMPERYGDGQVVVVKAHLEDELDNVLGGDDLKATLDGATKEMTRLATQPGDAAAWIYVVDTDADENPTALGDHMITVSHTASDTEVGNIMIPFAVAGPPISLSVSGDANIELNGSVTYTVTAKDVENGIPYFIRQGMDQNDMVTVSVQPTDALVVGTNTAGQVMLDDNGEATFIVYAALDAADGDHGRIIARLGELQDIEPITFGDPDATPDPMDDMFTAMYTVMADSPSSGMVEVSWVTTQPISLVMLMDDQGMVAAWDVALRAIGNSAQFSEIQAGEYQVVVFSLTAGDFSNGGLAFGSVTVE